MMRDERERERGEDRGFESRAFIGGFIGDAVAV